MASRGNQHCASCTGTLLFAVLVGTCVVVLSGELAVVCVVASCFHKLTPSSTACLAHGRSLPSATVTHVGSSLDDTDDGSPSMYQRTHTHSRLTALFPRLPRWAGTRKVKPVWILLKQETVSGNGISWAVCKSAPCSRQITMPAPHHSVFFTDRMPFLSPNQQHQSTEGIKKTVNKQKT